MIDVFEFRDKGYSYNPSSSIFSRDLHSSMVELWTNDSGLVILSPMSEACINCPWATYFTQTCFVWMGTSLGWENN